ncbi:unnamed protein product [Boreogadus saida]
MYAAPHWTASPLAVRNHSPAEKIRTALLHLNPDYKSHCAFLLCGGPQMCLRKQLCHMPKALVSTIDALLETDCAETKRCATDPVQLAG